MRSRVKNKLVRVSRKILFWDDDQSRDPLNVVETFLATWLLYFRIIVFVMAGVAIVGYGLAFVAGVEIPENDDWLSEIIFLFGFIGGVCLFPATVITVMTHSRKSTNRGRYNDLISEDSKTIDQNER